MRKKLRAIKNRTKRIFSFALYLITRIHKIPKKIYQLRPALKFFLVYSYHHTLAILAYNLNLTELLFLAPLKQIKGNKSKIRIAFVCTGNICRSPYAEYKMKKLLNKLDYQRLEIVSFGTRTTNGKIVDQTALDVALSRDVDLSAHRTQQITSSDIEHLDLLVFMSTEHYIELTRLNKSAAKKSIYLGAFLLNNSAEFIVEDPYGQDPAVFVYCYQSMDYALTALLNKVIGQCHLNN